MQAGNANVRSSSYYIANTLAHCQECNALSRVIALALPPEHEVRIEGCWQRADANAFIFFVAELPPSVGRVLQQAAPRFGRKWGDSQRNPYWVNHCEHCGSTFSDDALHCEPGGFMPAQPAEAEVIVLSQIAEKFSADAAGYALDPEFFSLMQRR